MWLLQLHQASTRNRSRRRVRDACDVSASRDRRTKEGGDGAGYPLGGPPRSEPAPVGTIGVVAATYAGTAVPPALVGALLHGVPSAAAAAAIGLMLEHHQRSDTISVMRARVLRELVA